MKYIISLIIIVTFFSCNPHPEGDSNEYKNGDFTIKTIDSCEYIEYDYGYGEQRVYSITHKGNCKFCSKRNKK